MKQSKELLEEIAAFHINPPEHHVVDAKVQKYDLGKLIDHVDGPRVLEMGYGDGQWTKAILEKFGRSSLVDASTVMIDQVNKLYADQVTTYNEFFEDFIVPDTEKFDTVVASHILEHVLDSVGVLKQVKSWLKPDGRAIIVVPNAQSFHRELAVKMGIQETIYDFSNTDREVGHVRVYDIESLRKDAEDAGFNIVFERGLFLKTLPNFMMTEFGDDLLKALVDISDDLPTQLMANLAIIVEAK